MKTFAIINQKGGVGKSTTAFNIAGGLTALGKKVLAVDLDPQESPSTCLQAEETQATGLNVLLGEIDIQQAIIKTPEAFLLPSGRNLAQADSLLTKPGREYLLKEALQKVSSMFDYAVIDTSPALGVLTVNAMVAADGLIIPTTADLLSLQGINYLMETVAPVKQYFNPSLKLEGILLTQYDKRAIISRESEAMAEEMAAALGSKVFNSKIRRSVAVKESHAQQTSLSLYAPNSTAGRDYTALIEELLHGEIDNG